MSGVAIVIAILKQDGGVGVAATSIYPGEIPEGARLPCIGVMQFLAVRKAVRYERGQITALGETSEPAAVFDKVSILPEGDGPDFKLSDPSIYAQSKDFMVTYSESNT